MGELIKAVSEERINEWLRHALGLAQEEDVFPWQKALLRRFRNGDIPDALDIPTGLGKTAVMAIWLVARACGASLPRRLVYVVDRRAVVDQATDVALSLRGIIDGDQALKAKLGLRAGQALPISTLRGQYTDDREWLEDPAAPAIIVGTVDMIGSRLLFEGYAVSRKMRPYHAGLLGADSLVVLDEAHLVPPFEDLLRALERQPAQPPVPPFRVLPLSATGRSRIANAYGLTEKDLEHKIVLKRLDATKSLRTVLLDKETRLEDALAKHAWALTNEGKRAVRVLVYSDSREVAQKALTAVERLAKRGARVGEQSVEIDLELLVGGRRVFEREQARGRLQSLGFIAESKIKRSRPAFVFATSAGEVGIDLDADHMVCDLVAWERMVQRLGRVNRRGEGHANIVVLVESKPRPTKKEQQTLSKRSRHEALTEKDHRTLQGYDQRVREWGNRQAAIKALRKQADGSFDASLRALLDLKKRSSTDVALREIVDGATTPEPLRPALARALVDSWAMTSLREHPGRPAIQPWLRGWIENDPPQTAIVWRKHLPVRSGTTAPTKREIEAYFEAAPPHVSEFLETETFRVAKWVSARAKSVRGGQLAAQEDTETAERPLRWDDTVVFVLQPDGGLRRSLTVEEIEQAEGANGEINLEGLFAGATLVVDARLAGLREGLLAEDESAVPRTADDGHAWLGDGSVGFRVRRAGSEGASTDGGKWRERLRFAAEVTEEGQATHWLLVEKWRNDVATEEDRSTGNAQFLGEHQTCTERHALRLATTLGLEPEYADLLVLAAGVHDEGKRVVRWQRAFNAPRDGIYAKTVGPISYSLLDGYRHELGSLLRAENDDRIRTLCAADRDLLLHLIASHHGFARPVIATSGCEDAPPSALKEKAAEIALRFARLQARWGPWGLAWWEALLRAADQQASRDSDIHGTASGVADG